MKMLHEEYSYSETYCDHCNNVFYNCFDIFSKGYKINAKS